MIAIPNHIIRPARYTGIEPNRIIKDLKGVSVRFALCYPDVYEVGMSYYGYFLLYELANTVEGVWCERCFTPWHDMDLYLRQRSLPLCTLESKTPLSMMDLVGFSLSYELNVTNVLNMLKLGGMPLRAADRQDGPIVIGGGPLMLNPKPFEKFFDLIVVGEAEDVLVEALETLKALKGSDRTRIIRELSKLEGLYSPLFRKESVKRLYIKDLDSAYHPLRPPIPVSGSIHNRLNIEVSRGCGNGCRFCLAGFGYRPYRERSFGRIKEIIDSSVKGTGYEEISLLSLSTGDYSSLFQTISYIKRHHKGISVSLPSLKIGSIGEDEIGAIGDIARTGFTFALESASPAIRCMINKNIDIDMLLKQLPLLRRYGWRRLKIYFMVGFPGEKEGDLAIIREIMRPFEQAGIEVNLSIAPFTPKPHTPFQWLPMEDGDVLREKMSMIRMLLKKKSAKIKYRDVATSMIEGIISRGDDALTPLFEYLAEKDVKLEAWREFFKPEVYHEWFNKNGLDMQSYLKGRALDRPLPWDFIDMGIDRSFLLDEARKAEHDEMTVDCYSGCAGCGIGCEKSISDFGFRNSELKGSDDQKRETWNEDGVALSGFGISELKRSRDCSAIRNPQSAIRNLQSAIRNPQSAISKKFTFRYGKYGDARYIGHIDTMNILLRALRASGVSIKMHGKYHPMPNIALTDALPVGIESVCELMEVETDGELLLASNGLKHTCHKETQIEMKTIPPNSPLYQRGGWGDLTALTKGVRGDFQAKKINEMLPRGMKIYEIIEGSLKDMVKQYTYILVSGEDIEHEELKRWRESGKNRFYLWKGKGIKLFWQKGVFKRIIKVEERKVYGR